MIQRLEKAIQEAFLAVDDASIRGISAANEAMLHLLQSPVFNDAYQNHYLSTDPKGMHILMHDKGDQPRSADPLRHLMDEHGAMPLDPNAPSTATAGRLLSLAAAQDELVRKILNVDPDLRQTPVIGILDDQGMHDLTTSMVGPDGDFSLSRFGIKYHHPSWRQTGARYLVAHTNLEVAGVLGITQSQQSPHSLSILYVSVNPGFRHQAVATNLYKKFIRLARAEDRYIVRSNATETTPPEVTSRFDQLLADSDVVHVISGTYLEGAISQSYAKGFDDCARQEIMNACNTVAKARQSMPRYSSEFSTLDYEQSMRARASVAPKPSSRPSPRR